MMRLRAMTMMDVAAGVKLNQSAGWNQTTADWERFLRANPKGCFVVEVDGNVCGTVTTISFEDRFAWVGMVLVDPEHRKKGLGTKLLEAAIRHLDNKKVSTIKLDATPQGKPLYEKLGFISEYEIERWTLQRSTEDMAAAHQTRASEVISAIVLKSILQIDGEVFGAGRSYLLKSLHHDAPEFTLAASSGGTLTGYTFGRRGLFADHLGPWMAEDFSSARQLLETFLAHSSRETLIVDCLKLNRMAAGLLRSCGFMQSRLLTRMYRGPNTYPGNPGALCAIMGPEFG